MRYPVFPSQPRSGQVPSMVAMGPPDFRPSSNVAPHYQKRFDMMFGRHLSGYGELESSDDEEMEYGTALNELRVMEELDDSSSSGIFDAPGTRPNIHPDEGIFADRMAWPGYIQRDPMYMPSEVRSITTNRPVTYVNAGAVAMDDVAKVAFIENRWANPPKPVVDFMKTRMVGDRSTVNTFQNPVPVSPAVAGLGSQALGAMPPMLGFVLGAAVTGLLAGVVYGVATSGRRR